MKKTILILLGAVLIGLFSCKNKGSDAQVVATTDTIETAMPDTLHYRDQVLRLEDIDSNSFLGIAKSQSSNDVVERTFDSLNVWAHDSTIVFMLESWDSLKLMSNPNDPTDGVVMHIYWRFSPALNSYITQNTYYENGDYSLINRKTGKKINLYGEPVLSPNKKMAVSSNADVMSGESANGFQILSVDPDGTDILWEVNTRGWGPEECRWKDNTTLYIRAICLGKNERFLKLRLPDFRK